MALGSDGLLLSDETIQGLQDGTVSQPSLFFVNEINSGLYRPGNGRIGIALLGAPFLDARMGNATPTDYTGLYIQASNSGQGLRIHAASSAANEALYVDPKGTGILYLNTQASTGATWIGAGGQVLLRGNMLLTNGSYFDIEQIAVPAAPAVGTRRMFVSSVTGALSVETSAGVVLDIELGAAPPGLNTQVVYNDAGAWGADANFTWNKATQVLTVTSITGHNVTGTLVFTAVGGGFITIPANTGFGLTISDAGANRYYAIDTRTANVNSIAHNFTNKTVSFASGAGATYQLVSLAPLTVTLTGGVGVTNMGGMALEVGGTANGPIIDSAVATTVTAASTVRIWCAPIATTSAVITNSYGLDMPGTTPNGSAINIANVAGTTYRLIRTGAHTVNFTAVTQVTSTVAAAALDLGIITITQSGGAVIVNNAATLYVGGAPVAGALVTITNAYAALILGGVVSLNASSNFAVNINSGNSTGITTIGNSLGGGVNVAANADIKLSPTAGNAILLPNNIPIRATQNPGPGYQIVLFIDATNLLQFGTVISNITVNHITTPLLIQATSQNATFGTITSGTTAITSAGALNMTSVAASTWAHSGGALAINSTSQNFTLATVTSGTLFLTSAGAITVSQGAAATWSVNTSLGFTGGILNFNVTSNFATNINTGTSTGAVNIGNSLAGVITIANKGNTAATMLVTDGTTNLLSLDTRNTATAAAITWTYTAPATMIINNAAGTTYSHVAYAALSYGLTNGTLVTAMKGLQLNLGVPTVTGAAAVTVTDASTLYVAAPAVGSAGPSVITNSAAIAVGGNILPDADNSYSVGSAARRFSLVRATTITSGDLRFENGWTFTEGDHVGLPADELIAISPAGQRYRLVMEPVA